MKPIDVDELKELFNSRLSRYIDADLLSEQVSNAYIDGDSPLSYHASSEGDTLIGKFQVLDLIYDLPTADVAEVKHGKWLLEREPDGKPYCFHCSVCDADFGRISIVSATPFCPWCGAKMDLKEKNDEEGNN